MIIFTDIDGVLNKSSQWNTLFFLDNDCIKHFCDFVKDIDGTIVLTSSWRKGFINTLSDNNLPHIKKLEKKLQQYDITIKDKISLYIDDRTQGIKHYLKYHPDKYIIIDDDPSEYSQIIENTYFVNSSKGFTQNDKKKLKRKYL